MIRRSFLGLGLPLLMAVAGCGQGLEAPKKPAPRVATSGVVRLDGEPLAGAVVVFLPKDESGTLTQGETDEEGHYALSFANMPGGTSPGAYRVSISYLVSPGGEPQGLSARSALVTTRDFAMATERLPERYSDMGRSELSAVVPPEGGTFDFDLEGPLLPMPKPEEPTADTAEQASSDPPPVQPLAAESGPTPTAQPSPE